MADPYVQSIRRALAGERRPQPAPSSDWQKGESANHEGAIVTGNYALDPRGPWRAVLIAWLTHMLEVSGLWCSRFDDEFGSRSHKAHHYAWQDACLYFALLDNDREVLDLIMRVECGVHAAESLCATPDGRLVMPGARCDIGNPKAADQTQQGDHRWQWLEGRKVRLPKLLASADDWLGLYCLVLLDEHHPGTRLVIRDRKSELPLLHNGLAVERTAQGHVARLLSVNGTIRPALWAMATYADGGELYGCDPSWPVNYRPETVNEIPAPKCPGGPGRITEVRRPPA